MIDVYVEMVFVHNEINLPFLLFQRVFREFSATLRSLWMSEEGGFENMIVFHFVNMDTV